MPRASSRYEKRPASTGYRAANIALLVVVAQFVLIPLLPDGAKQSIPGLGACAYKELTERPCMFCGMTRDARAALPETLVPGEGPERGAWHNPASPVALPLFLLLALHRAAMATAAFAFPNRVGRRWIGADTAVTALLAGAIILVAHVQHAA